MANINFVKDQRHGLRRIFPQSSWYPFFTVFWPSVRGKNPKFGQRNKVNVPLCQHYPAEFHALTLVEEALIARYRPSGIILKLRRYDTTGYDGGCDHMIVLPQDPTPLLTILPSPTLELDTIIKAAIPIIFRHCHTFHAIASYRDNHSCKWVRGHMAEFRVKAQAKAQY